MAKRVYEQPIIFLELLEEAQVWDPDGVVLHTPDPAPTTFADALIDEHYPSPEVQDIIDRNHALLEQLREDAEVDRLELEEVLQEEVEVDVTGPQGEESTVRMTLAALYGMNEPTPAEHTAMMARQELLQALIP